MLHIFFDASVLIKRYTDEPGTPLVNDRFLRVPHSCMVCSARSHLEVIWIFVRKRNDGRISQPLFERAMLLFKTEVLDNSAFRATSVSESVLLAALSFILQHHLNATDAIILRSALDLAHDLTATGDTLLRCTADKRLLRATQAEGIPVFDPETDTIDQLHYLLGIAPHP